MKEEIFKDLLNRYYYGKEVRIAYSKSEEVTIDTYDYRLLTISLKDIGEDDENASRLLEVRCRKDDGKECEELVLVTGKKGAVREVKNIEEDLMGTAEIIEAITTGLVEHFPDKVLVWNWLGQ